MRQAFRPYVKVLKIGASTAKLKVDLTDSSGTPMECNYIQVEPLAGGFESGWFLVVPIISASSTAMAADSMPTASSIEVLTGIDLSGVTGGAGNMITGAVVLSLATGDKSKSLYISQSSATATWYSITYGNVRVSNSLSDNQLPTGN